MGTEPVPRAVGNFEDLLRDLEHPVWEVRRNAGEGLAALGDARAVKHLIAMLDDEVGAVRFAAAEALGKIGDPVAVPVLLERLENKDFGAVGPLIESLANLKAVEAIPYFINFLRDHDARVRGLAANALMVMTKQFISFKAKGTRKERETAIAEWEVWWKKNKDTFHL